MDITRAQLAALCDQVPNQFVDVAVTTNAATVDLSALPYAPAQLTYEFTGVDTTVIAAATVVVIGGRNYTTDEEVAISGTTVQVGLTAALDGYVAATSLYVGQNGALAAPIVDIENAGEVITVDDRGESLDAGGKRLTMLAIGGAVTVMRGDHSATLAAAAGLIVGTASNPLQSFYVSEKANADNTLTHIAAGSVTLRIMFSDDFT
jgi:hypothetical protein